MIDARSHLASVGNTVKGKGSEAENNYTHTTVILFQFPFFFCKQKMGKENLKKGKKV